MDEDSRVVMVTNPMSSNFRSVPPFFLKREQEFLKDDKDYLVRYTGYPKSNEIFLQYINDNRIRFVENDKIASVELERAFTNFLGDDDPVWVSPFFARDVMVGNAIKNNRKIDKEDNSVKTVLKSIINRSFEYIYGEEQDSELVDLVRAAEYGSMDRWLSVKDERNEGRMPRRRTVLFDYTRQYRKYGMVENGFPFIYKYYDTNESLDSFEICSIKDRYSNINIKSKITKIPRCYSRFDRLEHVWFGNNNIRFFENVKSSLLERLYCHSCHMLNSLKTLPRSDTLTRVDLSWTSRLKDLDGLERAKNLVTLDIEFSEGLMDLTALQDLKKLEVVRIENSFLGYWNKTMKYPRDIKSLKELNLDKNKIEDIEWIGTLTNLERLHIKDNSISDIEPLKYLKKLRVIELDGNKVSNIDPLMGLTNIEHISLHANPVDENGCQKLKQKFGENRVKCRI